MTKFNALLAVSLALTGCGGGGSSSPPPAPVVASVKLNVSTAPINLALATGDEVAFTIDGAWSGSNLQSPEVYLQVRDAQGRFVTPAAAPLTAGAPVRLSVTTDHKLAPGSLSGSLDLIACKDAKCAASYDASAISLPYVLTVSAVGDWETHQRDAGHRGFVPIILNPARFAKAWEWRHISSDPIGGINAIITANGKVYTTSDVYFGEGRIYALDEKTGAETWRASLGNVPAMNPPAVSGGTVYAAVTGHQATALFAYDAETGKYKFKSTFSVQWPQYLAPTVFGEQVFQGGGYYNGETHAFSTQNGTLNWTAQGGGGDKFSVAVDERSVYASDGQTLFIHDRISGANTAKITDPIGQPQYSYHGAPMLGGRQNVVTFSGGAFSGRASANVQQYEQRPLSSFAIASKSYEWSSAYAYLTVPAVANGVIYAARNSPMSFDAIDETSGKVLWSWKPSGNDSSFNRNIVVTRNIVFVSTDLAVYAIDLTSKAQVWSYPKPGMLAISANRTLLIATGARESDGGIVAISMK